MHRKTKYFLTFLILFLACHLSLSAKSFEVRAVYLDFRTQVMTMPAMKEFVADAASKGMNAVVVEWEATFPFKDNLVLRNRFAFSEAEVKDFIAYCSGLGVDVIPLQNCFGHSEYILRHERYAVLKEDRKDCSQVCPMMEDEAEGIFRSIFSEIAQMHTSGYFHIGCDETRLLGHCRRCQEKVRSEGTSRLYVDYVARMCRIVSSLGKRPMIWADIILKHPEALQSLPEDVIIVDWNYGWNQDHFGKMDNLRNSGRRSGEHARCVPILTISIWYNGESTWRTYSVTLHTHPTADSKESSTLRGRHPEPTATFTMTRTRSLPYSP